MKFTSAIFASACLLALANDRVSAEKMKIGRDRLRRELKPGKGKGKGSCSSLSTGAFCSIAERVATGSSECRDVPGNLDIDLCPTQDDVCDPTFTVASFCEEISGSACLADCELAVSGCCELNCCEDTCFDEEQVCELFELFRCPDINFEICPCADDERSTQEYCEALLGPVDDKPKARCFNSCFRYVQGCCGLPSAFRRSVWINEFHHNENGTPPNSGDDDNEYVEIAFTNSVDLQGYELWAFNGQVEGGRQPSNLPYEIVTLSSSPQFDPWTGVNFLQVFFDVLEDGGGKAGDSAHDGIALVDPDGNVVEFISYGSDANFNQGTARMTRMINGVSVTSTPLTATAMGVTETGSAPVTDTLQRQGTGCAGDDFVWMPPQSPTPGSRNANQAFNCAL